MVAIYNWRHTSKKLAQVLEQVSTITSETSYCSSTRNFENLLENLRKFQVSVSPDKDCLWNEYGENSNIAKSKYNDS